jgi:hypothetical protein
MSKNEILFRTSVSANIAKRETTIGHEQHHKGCVIQMMYEKMYVNKLESRLTDEFLNMTGPSLQFPYTRFQWMVVGL